MLPLVAGNSNASSKHIRYKAAEILTHSVILLLIDTYTSVPLGNSCLLTSGAVTFRQKGEDPPAETLGRPTGLGTENKLYLATPKLKQSLNREGQMQLDKAET